LLSLSLTETLLRPLSRSTARPLVTHYDDAAGTRVELSVATLTNWAAKTANWLVEEHDVEPGDPVSVALPAHWQTAGVLLGAWWCGARVVAEAAGASVAFVPPGGEVAGAGVVAAVSLDPMGRDLGAQVPTGVVDFVADARLHGDDFFGSPVDGGTLCLGDSTVDEVLTEARKRAESLGLSGESRVLSTLDWTVPDGVLAGFLTVLAAGASLVQVTNPNPDLLDRHRATERTTLDLS
jgi:uncharacterized protein (TIGR03089 family)